MSSGSYNPNFEDALKHYNNAKRYYDESDYQKALLHLEKAIEIRPPIHAIYYLKAECLLIIKDYKNALKAINDGLDIFQEISDESSDAAIYHMKFLLHRHKIYSNLGNTEGAHSDMQKIEALLNENYQNSVITKEQYHELSKELKGKVDDNMVASKGKIPARDKEKEAKKVWDLIQEAKTKNLLGKEHNIVHLISMRWFEKWKKYTNFSTFSHEKYEYNSEDIEENGPEHPGQIDPDDILDKTDIFIDPDKVKDYCNYVVKMGLEENKDFIIVSHPIWKYLHAIYSGKDVKRFVISINDDTNQTAVEIWLKRLNVLVCPVISKSQNYTSCQIKTLYLSKKETIKELREKISRIFKEIDTVHNKVNLGVSKIWKLDPRADYKEVVNKVMQSNDAIVIRATKLDETTVLEDAELGDGDIVICEYKFDEQWKFKSESEHQQDQDNRCGYCGTVGKNLSHCQCMTIKYCNHECQKNHRAQHKEKCNTIKGEQDKQNEIYRQFKINKASKFQSSSRYGITGLQNLGNTCFMNSSLQCLSNVFDLTNYFIGNDFIKDLNRENRLGTGGKLAAAYAELVKEIWHGTESYVSPWDIKRIIGEVASQFCGYNQQDSQEFLSYMLDGLHEDLNRIKKKPFVESVESNNSKPDEVVAAESWMNHLKRNQSIIVDLMHGQYKSKLVCPDCGKVSITFDPYMSISLPIPAFNFISIPLYFIYKDSKKIATKLTLNLQPNAPASELIKTISKYVDVPEYSIELNLLKEHRVIDYKTSKYDAKALKEHEGMLFAIEAHAEEFDPPFEQWKGLYKFRIELLMKQETRRGGEEEISFSRVFYIPYDTTTKLFHLNIWLHMRYFIRNCLVAEGDNGQYKSIQIDIEKSDMATLESEYAQFLACEEKPALPYQLLLQRIIGRQTNLETIPYKSSIKMNDIIQETKEPVTIELFLTKLLKNEYLKLNKCQDSPQSGSSLKEPKNYSIYECIDLFTKPELLDKENLWYCNACKDHKQATKTMEIYKTPKILILHLKRFRTNRVSSIGSFFYTSSSSKITSLVDFPVKGLDMRRYILGQSEDSPMYDLFAISNHFGGLGGGHYTAFAKNQQKDAWFDFNDSSVSRQDPNELVTEAAYVLFYKRRDSGKPNSAMPNANLVNGNGNEPVSPTSSKSAKN
jgi:ubiquitin carboxyl-terminal hydrolase 4/11/15